MLDIYIHVIPFMAIACYRGQININGCLVVQDNQNNLLGQPNHMEDSICHNFMWYTSSLWQNLF